MGHFVHLHLHSHYSVLDGLGHINDIVHRAKELGMPAVAVTDHGSISSMASLFKEAKEAGIKPIIGCEFYVVDTATPPGKGEKETRWHMTVWPKNWDGVQSVMRSLTIANRQFYKRPRLTIEQAMNLEDCIVGTACSFGLLARDDWHEVYARLSSAYGENLYLEIMPYAHADAGVDYQPEHDTQLKVNSRALELRKLYGAKLVATSDAHYVRREDASTHEVLLCIQTGKAWNDPTRWRFNGDHYYMHDQADILARFRSLGYIPKDAIIEAIANTCVIAEKINVELPELAVELPSVAESGDDNAAFKHLVIKGWETLLAGKLNADSETTYKRRLLYEINAITRLGFIKYFMIVWDMITWARSHGIMVGPGRGSAAGSLVSYLLGITQLDPMKHGLYFERFLNPERVSMPDIDVDFMDTRRSEVFDYIRSKYGHNHTANINTFGVLTTKSAFRDVARVFGVSPMTVNMLSKQIEDVEAFDEVPELLAFAKRSPEVIEHTKRLTGTIRQNGVHACGVVVSSRPLEDVSVVERRKGEVEVVNWDMRECEKFGLLKIDVLGLTTLTIIDHALKLIEQRHGHKIDMTTVNLDDKATLENFAMANTAGVFQFEANGMRSLLKDVKADTFDAITDCTALYRPGSLNSGQTAQYIQVAKGHEDERFLCEELRPILGPTKGVLVYQEQIMRIFNELGGFTWAQADQMRKIIGKKLGKDEFEKHRAPFVDGCKARGISESVAASLFSQMVEFAAYSFNKSHAAAYALVSYWCMWLKTYYQLEFMAACLSMYSADAVAPLVRECERLGIVLQTPDINRSDVHFLIDDNEIIAPLGSVKGVGEKAVEAILEARKSGVFLSYDDFVERVNRRICNIRVQDTLVRAGAFESLGKRESDPEVRVKNFMELLPTFHATPNIERKGKVDEGALMAFLGETCECAKAHKMTPMMPVYAHDSRTVAIMVVNNNVKGETEHLTNDCSRALLKELAKYRIKAKDIYYTGATKCYQHVAKDCPKECQAKCLDYLRQEIKIVRPKLIVVFASQLTQAFTKRKPHMAELNGTFEYNKELDAYVLFSYSPQYGQFNDKALAGFEQSMEQLARLFGVVE